MAYGVRGSGFISSVLGRTGELPYAADDAMYTTRLTSASRAATRTLRVPSMLIWFAAIGSSTDLGTEASAAQ